MSHLEQQLFCESVKNRFPRFFENVIALDIGSLDINGNNKSLFINSMYIGLDVAVGKNVDVVTPGHLMGFPDDTCDIIVSTECFEHDQYYKKTIKNIYRMLKPGGLFVFTCATTGRPEHGTRRTTPDDAPLLQTVDGWSDYYKNLTEVDIKEIFDDFDSLFSEYEFSTNEHTKDLYFWGFKAGIYTARDNYSFLLERQKIELEIDEIRRELDFKSKEFDKIISEKNKIDDFKEQLLKQQSDQIEEQKKTILFYQNNINELDATILDMKNSWSFKLTIPLRFFRRHVGKSFSKVYRLYNLARENPRLVFKTFSYISKYGFKAAIKRIVSASNYNYIANSPWVGEIDFKNYKCINILTSPHCIFIAKNFEQSICKFNIDVNIIFEEPKDGFSSDLHIVISPQFFKDLPDCYISYQLEQSVSSRWFDNRYLSILKNSYAVFDYSEDNLNFLQKNEINFSQLFYMPVSYNSSLKRYIDNEFSYDVIFYGDIENERRKSYIKSLSNKFTVKVINNLFGDDLYSELNKAKVVVNIHYYDDALLETTRLYECLSLNKLVVSEKSADMNNYPDILRCVDFVDVDNIEQMIDHVSKWLSDDNRLKEKIQSNIDILSKCPNWFEYYFMRYCLSKNWIDFDEFYRIAGKNIQFNGDFICLGLPESVDRKESFVKDNDYNIEYFPGLRHDVGWVGCGLSYKFIIRKAKELGYEQVTVCEDDVLFHDDFGDRYNNIKNFLNELKIGDWDVFSGLIADLDKNTEIISVNCQLGEEFITIDRMVSMVFNIYSSGFYDKILEWNSDIRCVETNTIDRFLESKGCKTVVTSKFLVGHKEELNSTLWQVNNTTYNYMIENSEKALINMKDSFLRAK